MSTMAGAFLKTVRLFAATVILVSPLSATAAAPMPDSAGGITAFKGMD